MKGTTQISMHQAVTKRYWCQIEHTLRKPVDCLCTRKSFYWKPHVKINIWRLNYTRRRELKAKINNMEDVWMEMQEIAKDTKTR